jgi:hypothetical protein
MPRAAVQNVVSAAGRRPNATSRIRLMTPAAAHGSNCGIGARQFSSVNVGSADASGELACSVSTRRE